MRVHGFSLIELMVTLSIMVIAVTIAIPSINSTFQNNRTVSGVNELVGAMRLAKSEALKRGQSVTVCAAADDTFSACGGAGDWTNGWLVFLDPNEDGNFSAGAGEVLITTHPALDPALTVTPTPNRARTTFAGTGFTTAGTGGIVFGVTASGCTGNHARNLTVNRAGALTITEANC